MLLRFKTKRDINGHRRYLAIDTVEKIYCKECPYMIIDGIEVKTSDIRELEKKLGKEGFSYSEKQF